jgi:hypothetical protein
MIGKYFSNGWKILVCFPTIGKFFRLFSNDWKNFREAAKNTKSTKESRVAGGMREESGREATRTGRKPLRGQERAWKSDFFETTWTTRDNS